MYNIFPFIINFSESKVHKILLLADAYTYLFMLERMVEAIEKCEIPGNKKALIAVCSLWALHNIESDMGK